jgi:GABA permease
VLGLWPGRDLDFSNLTEHGGFFPNGVGALCSGIVIVIFSMVGAEIATIAAAESDEPERGIVRATNSVVLRILVFFVGSIFLLATILPWNSTELGHSPYVSAMEEMGIPAAAEIMNFVLTAVLSCLNSGLYTASRMLFVLAARNEAPARLLTINRSGVPMWSIIASTIVGFACVLAAYISPDTVVLFLLNSSGAIILFVYLMICLSQLRMRRMVAPERLRVKMWFYPVLTAAVIVAVLVSMFIRDDTRSQILLSLLAWALVLVAYLLRRRAIGDAHLTESGIAAEQRADAWMHEHGAAAELEVDAAVSEGPLDPQLIRRIREEGYANEGV